MATLPQRTLDVRPEVLHGIALNANRAASSLSFAGQVETLSRAADRTWNGTTYVTLYPGGVRDTTDGLAYAMAWPVFCGCVSAYTDNVIAKGQGAYLIGALSSNGRNRDLGFERAHVHTCPGQYRCVPT